MSRTTALAVAPDRRPAALLELRNAHGWSPSIWSRLMAARGITEHWIFADAALNRLCQEIETLPEWQQAPLVLTFDTGVIPCADFEWAAEMLDEFEARVPSNPDHVNHVPAVAALLRERPETPFFGVWGTSVSGNPFDPWDDEMDAPGHGIAMDELYLLERHRAPLPAS